MPVINSPNMNLPIPVVGSEPGPQYASDVNSSLTLLDGHDHSAGSGVQVTPDGLNINSDLSFQSNRAIAMGSIVFSPQVSALATINTIYQQNLDLYFVDGAGNNVRITQAGGVAGSPGSISNLVAPASATYVAVTRTFVWESDASIAANLDAASLTMRNISPNSTFGLTLNPPNALSVDYDITLPSLPASTKLLTMTSAGVQAAVTDVDNTTIEISSNNLQVKDLGISTAKIADSSVTSAKTFLPNIASNNIASAISTSLSPTYTNMGSVAVTGLVAGKPVFVEIAPQNLGATGSLQLAFLSGASNNGINIQLHRSDIGGVITTLNMNAPTTTSAMDLTGKLRFVDTSAPSGSVTYTIYAAKTSASGTVSINFTNVKMIAYQF